MILINKYSNRKMYNTHTSKYINLKGIYNLLQDKKALQVMYKGEDVTFKTITKAFYEAGIFDEPTQEWLTLHVEHPTRWELK